MILRRFSTAFNNIYGINLAIKHKFTLDEFKNIEIQIHISNIHNDIT